MGVQQKIIFNQPSGKIEINGHRVEQSKDVIKQVRFEPDNIERLKQLCFDHNLTFSDFMRTASEFAFEYFDHVSAMMRPEVKDVVVTVVKGLSKNF